MKCLNCGEEFAAKRKTAKFCSAKCRVYTSRGLTFKDRVVLPTIKEAKKIVEDSGLTGGDILRNLTKFCKHGYHPTFCKFAKPGKPCK